MDKDHLLQKWLSDELNDEETKAFHALEDAHFYTTIIEDAAQFKASQFSSMPSFEVFKERLASDKVPVRTLQWLKPMFRIASVLVIGLGIYLAFFYNQLIEVQTMVVEKTTISLPDASQIVLNSLSEVRYNEAEWEDNRVIELKGEAFFDVAKGAKFDVVTPTGTVSVLGTEFNVKQRGGIFEVACFEGTVRVVSGKNTVTLSVGDNFKSINGDVVTGKHTYEMPQWVNNNMSEFQRIPVSEVFAELERQYGITVQAEHINAEQHFTGGFVNDNLENALKAISEPLGLDYIIINPANVRFSMSE